MSFIHRVLVFCGLVLAGFAGTVQAHQIPSLGLEVEIQAGGLQVLRLNIDPRLFLSQAPATLPPIEASWYREQNPEQIRKTHDDAAAYLQRTLKFLYGPDTATKLEWSFQPMDGGSNQPLGETSTEVHLLGEAHYKPPAASTSLTVGLAADSAAALTILTVIDGKPGRRPQVLFPGETGKPISWAGAPAPQIVASAGEASQPSSSSIPSAWYAAPMELGFWHAIRGGNWHHLWFVLVLGLFMKSVKEAVVALLGFHAVHLTATFACSWNQTVLEQPLWMWPAAVASIIAISLVANRTRRWMLVAAVIGSLAVLHSLNQWPHAAQPRVLLAMEAAFFAGHLACLLPVIALKASWARKRAAV